MTKNSEFGGKITLFIDEDMHVTKIMLSDLQESDVTVFLSCVDRFFGWSLRCIDSYRYLAIFTPTEEIRITDLTDVRKTILAECAEFVKDVIIVQDQQAIVLRSIIKELHHDITLNTERLASHQTELHKTQLSGDEVERGVQEQSIETLRTSMKQLDEKIQRDKYLLTFLETEGWDGLCPECEDPVPLKRVFIAHNLMCVHCATKNERRK